jgi:hypothetical protein
VVAPKMSDITITLHHRDVRRLLNALRRSPLGAASDPDEQEYTWQLVQILSRVLGEEVDF